MFGLPPRFPISNDIGKAMAKGIKKGVFPESPRRTRDQIEEAKICRAERRLKPSSGSKRKTRKPGILARLRNLFSPR